MTAIICLANSLKRQDRCVAGIEIATGKWVRPVSQLEDGRIPTNWTVIDGTPIAPLDIIDIPLSDQHHGYELENRLLLEGAWERVGKKEVVDLLPFCEDRLLHDRSEWHKCIPYVDLLKIPLQERRTIQIIYTDKLTIFAKEAHKWRCNLHLSREFDYSITDTDLRQKLDSGYELGNHALVVMSLSQPFQKDDSINEKLCYRLVVAILPMGERDVLIRKIDREMAKTGWSQEQGRAFIREKYNQTSRRSLSLEELERFLDHLYSL